MKSLSDNFNRLIYLLLFLIPFSGFSQNCDLDYSFTNTGSNMIIMVTQNALSNDVLVIGDSLGAFTEIDGEIICVGAIEWTGLQQTLAVWGNDSQSSFQDGLLPMDEITLKAQSNGVIYDVAYSPVFTFEVNGIEILSTSLSFIPLCDTIGNVYGCTTQNYEEYNSMATIDDGSCNVLADISGCTIESYVEYNPLATTYDGSCSTLVINGCTDVLYMEYFVTANTDNGSCSTLIIEGCTNENYIEFNPLANIENQSCEIFIVYGCIDSNYLDFSFTANTDDGSCLTLKVEGCMNSLYVEYNPMANFNNSSCSVIIDMNKNPNNYTALFFMRYLYKTPQLLKWYYPSLIWDFTTVC